MPRRGIVMYDRSTSLSTRRPDLVIVVKRVDPKTKSHKPMKAKTKKIQRRSVFKLSLFSMDIIYSFFAKLKERLPIWVITGVFPYFKYLHT